MKMFGMKLKGYPEEEIERIIARRREEEGIQIERPLNAVPL
jgi:DNA helicase TIP49 (TBP-interacting protein)